VAYFFGPLCILQIHNSKKILNIQWGLELPGYASGLGQPYYMQRRILRSKVGVGGLFNYSLIMPSASFEAFKAIFFKVGRCL